MVYLFILYTTFGGYRSVVRTDAFNLTLLSIGLFILFFTIVSRVGAWVSYTARQSRFPAMHIPGWNIPPRRENCSSCSTAAIPL